jgi:DNA polymerase elongation subunit (family B)
MDIALTIAHMSQISIFKAASPVAITEALLCREFLGKNLVMATDPKAPPVKREQYEGAFVKEPITGMHNAVACFDFASLYPSVMRQMNVSPESFIKKVDPDKRDKEKSDKTIVSVTGAVYDTERSILKEVLTRLYSQRREYKKKSFELQQKAYQMEQELKKS